jgi:Tol biopolymer transport system component
MLKQFHVTLISLALLVGVFCVFGNQTLADIAPAVQLTNDPGDDFHPNWSPVDNRIAWRRWNYKTVWTMETDGTHLGTNLLKITTDGGPCGDWDPEWRKPDGAQIYFTTDRADFWYFMRVPSTGGSETWLWTVPGGGNAWSLSSSPDGSQFAFTYLRPSPSYPDRIQELRIVNADFTDIQTILTLSNLSGDGECPIGGCSWSPDGNKIAIGLREAHSVYHIALIHPDGTGLTTITDGEVIDRYPQYSPDGNKIAFLSNKSGNWDIWVVNADGTNRTQITDNPADDGGDDDCTWSPDGKKIAFASNRSGNYDIWAIDVSMLYSGSINGHVTDRQTGDPIRAIVIAKQGETKVLKITNKSGYYEMPELQTGEWQVVCIKQGYKLGIKKVEVSAGEPTVCDFSLTPKADELLPNYPDPFNPETWIPFRLSQDSFVTISIYDGKGQFIRTINLGEKRAGSYITRDKAAYWDGKNDLGERVSSGVYFYTLQAGEFKATRRMLIVK